MGRSGAADGFKALNYGEGALFSGDEGIFSLKPGLPLFQLR